MATGYNAAFMAAQMPVPSYRFTSNKSKTKDAKSSKTRKRISKQSGTSDDSQGSTLSPEVSLEEGGPAAAELVATATGGPTPGPGSPSFYPSSSWSPKSTSHSIFKQSNAHPLSRNRSRNSDDTVESNVEQRQVHASSSRSRYPSKASVVAGQMTGLAPRSESLSSNSGTTSLSNRTMTSTDATGSWDHVPHPKPFVLRNGRTYLNDATLPYPLPTDLTELHRQSMRTLLLIQVFGAPVCSPIFAKRPPQRVLEVGCGSGFWSMMCHRYFKARGHDGICFTGIDIAPLAPNNSTNETDAVKPDAEMKWNFISHDLRQMPWPVPDEEYDLIMIKDLSLVTTNSQFQTFTEEYLRVLRPGGVMEIWESDHLIRMLKPHFPDHNLVGDDMEEYEAAAALGAYVMNANTPLTTPLNRYIIEYNQWLSKALELRDLTAVPCTLVGPALLQESETLTDIKSRRLAIPLSELRWERDGSSSKGSDKTAGQRTEKRNLTPGQDALRKTSLLTVVQQVQALEPILREVSGKSQDEWDQWLGKMMGDLMSNCGTSWGECLEVGAWWATKRKTAPKS